MNWPKLARRNGNGGNGNGDLISMENLEKVYDMGRLRVSALNSVTLSIRKGEFVAVVGPSGSGKSTLMNLIGCLDTPTGGSYFLAGQAVAGLGRDALADVRNRSVGFVFQNFNLMPQLTALENVEMPMLFGGVPSRERRRRATELLTRLGLADRAEHRPAELSGGQMQRVAVARALAMDPDVILADEPTGNLDSASGSDVMSLLRDLWQQGRTVIVVTHDSNLASMATRSIELKDGRVTRDTGHLTGAGFGAS